jgi:hypothetical protein
MPLYIIGVDGVKTIARDSPLPSPSLSALSNYGTELGHSHAAEFSLEFTQLTAPHAFCAVGIA